MYVIYEIASDYSISPMPGKYQFGDIAHAKNRVKKSLPNDLQTSLKWEMTGVAGLFPDAKKAYKGFIDGEAVFIILQLPSKNLRTNPAPGKAPYTHKGYEIWNMGGRHWAYRKPRTDNYIGEFATVKAAMIAIDKLRNNKMRNNPERISAAWLKKRVGLLNDMLDRPETAYTKKADGGLTGNRGHLFIDSAYGGVKVAEMAGNGTGENNISDGYVPKRELNNFINGMIAGVREAQAGRKQNPTHKKTPGYSAGFKMGKGKRKMAKKKRSAKQLANDKRLGRMAKARAKAKRGGARKKIVRKKVARKTNPKRTVSAKSHLWIVFACKGKTVRFLSANASGKFAFIPTSKRSHALMWKIKSEAVKQATRAERMVPWGYKIGVISEDTTSAQIIRYCTTGK